MSSTVGDRRSEEKGTGREFFIPTSQPPSLTLPAVQLCASAIRESQGRWKNVQLVQALSRLATILLFHLASRSPQESLAVWTSM